MRSWSRIVVLALACVLAAWPVDVSAEVQVEEVGAFVAPVSAELAVATFNVLTVTTIQATTIADVGQAPESPSVATQELTEEQGARIRGASSSGSARSSRYTSGGYDVLKMPHARGT